METFLYLDADCTGQMKQLSRNDKYCSVWEDCFYINSHMQKKKRRIELQLCYFTCSPFKHVLSCLLTTPTMEHLSTVLGITINSLRWGVGNYNWWTRTGRVPAGGYLWQIRITGRESKKEMVSTFGFLKVGCRWLAVMFLQCLVSRLLA